MLKKIEYATLNDVVYERIKEQIIDNVLKPGERIDTDDLSEQLGVSKTPIVNALKALEKDGYVTINARSGTYVRCLSREEIEAIFDFRLVLEKLAVEKSIGIADENVMQSFLKKFEKIEKNIVDTKHMNISILEKYFYLEIELHEYIISLCPQIIGDQIQNILDLTKRLRKLQLKSKKKKKGQTVFIAEEIQSHIQLINAILSGDMEKAIGCIVFDITKTKTEVI